MSQQATSYNRAKIWQIGLFALNNTATNMALSVMGYLAFFSQNVLGVAAAVIGVILTSMRIFDGITDPIIGLFIDKTDGKFGKFRPFMFVGNIIIVSMIFVMFSVVPNLEQNLRLPALVIVYIVYIFGYTFQTACTKAAQACLTNDPEQRPLFAVFDGIYNTVLFAVSGLVVTSILPPKFDGGMLSPELWKTVAIIFGSGSFVLTILAIIGIWEKDRTEFFGVGTKENVGVKDYVSIIKSNRAIQMLVIAASTDKLAGNLAQAGALYFYGNILLDVSLSGKIGLIMTPLTVIVTFIGVAYARKMGQKKAFVVTTWGSLFMLAALLIIQPFEGVSLTNINFNTIMFLTLTLLQRGFMNVSGNMVIPMIADCSDYETYKSGKFVPGMMGTLFSFVDKLISSLSSTILGVGLAAIGLGNAIIEPGTPASSSFFILIISCMYIVPILGHLASLIAMKFYPLTSEKMAEIQSEIEEAKRRSSAI